MSKLPVFGKKEFALIVFLFFILLLTAVNINYPKKAKVLGYKSDNENLVNQKAYLEQILLKHPSYFDALLYLGQINYQLGNYEEVENLLSKAKKINPNSNNIDFLESLIP